MGEGLASRSTKWRHRLVSVADRLVSRYGTPTLGNFRDPVKEIFYILLSARTSERLYQRAHALLFGRFPRVHLLASAAVPEVLECVKGAGLGKKRAVQITKTAKQLVEELGPNPQRRLRKMSASDAYRYLIDLPGLGPKSALCVMMSSLDHDVFPVDVNVQRIFERLGVIRRGLKHYQAQKIAPRFVPAGRSKELHVGLVEHGRKFCLPNRPRCDGCFLSDLCKHGSALNRRR